MITTADYLALSPQERWVIIEERVFGCRVDREWRTPLVTRKDGRMYSLQDRDQPNGWWEIVEEMERKGSWPQIFRSQDKKSWGVEICAERGWELLYAYSHPNIALAVQVAALQAVRFIEE